MRNERSRGQRDYPIDDSIAGQRDGHDQPAINPDDEAVELPFLGRDALFVAGEDAVLLESRGGTRR